MPQFSDRVLAKLARKRIERDEVELVLADPSAGRSRRERADRTG
jgi:hypothetical protein